MHTVLSIVGARPQFIKAAALSKAISQSKQIREVILHTGQHYDARMSDIFFNELAIPAPSYVFSDLPQGHGKQTGTMLSNIERVLEEDNFDMVVLFGDTNSTLAGALAAAKLNIPIAHIEAGLRSFDMAMPEEINRVITDQLSTLHFCPTIQALNNLASMGIKGEHAVVTGDIMLDALLMVSNIGSNIPNSIVKQYALPYAVVTFHRSENIDNPDNLNFVVQAIEELSKFMHCICPLHPRTRTRLMQAGLEQKLSKYCQLMEPVGYIEMIKLINGSSFVVTDSGGLQKEAYFMKKKCIVLRKNTEWVELLANDASVLFNSHSNTRHIERYLD